MPVQSLPDPTEAVRLTVHQKIGCPFGDRGSHAQTCAVTLGVIHKLGALAGSDSHPEYARRSTAFVTVRWIFDYPVRLESNA